jgi:D-hydroxyproline dehydrogenase
MYRPSLLSCEIAVIGGGVIGMAVALRLAREGRSVMLIEPNEPGYGASFGNAGTIADYGVLPVANPAVLRSLPSLILDRDSPLAVRMAALPGLLPWIARFMANCTPARARANAAALGALLGDATALWRELAAEIGAAEHLHQDGCLYVYDTAAALHAGTAEAAFRRDYGATVEVLNGLEVSRLEPKLPPVAGAQYFPGAVNIDDPGVVMAKLAGALTAAGVEIVKARVGQLQRTAGKVVLDATDLQITAQTVVVAAGAASRGLAAQAGDRLPLDTERGYHLEYDMAELPLRRVVCPAARGFYAVPMAGRLRIAGTVELGGLKLPPDPRRHALLERGARSLFPDLPEPDRRWFGFRPSMPDSVPIIRPSSGGSDVILAFGHGHLGLTLAPTTAARVSDFISAKR